MFSFLHTTEVIQIPPHLPVDALVVCLCVCVCWEGGSWGEDKEDKDGKQTWQAAYSCVSSCTVVFI